MCGSKIIFGLLCVVVTVFGACPDGWLKFRGHCYKYTSEIQNWVDARVMCRMHGADLMSIETPEEQAEFVKQALTFNHTDVDSGFWLSGTDWSKDGTWVWEATKRPLTYAVWGAGQPNNRNNSENCLAGMLYFNYIWSDEFCDWDKLQYVCEMEEQPQGPVVG